MELNLDPIYLVNLTLCIVLVVLGYLGYKKSKDKIPLYVGIAFGCFCISHISSILNLKETIEPVLILIRIIGYLLVIFALYKYWKRQKVTA